MSHRHAVLITAVFFACGGGDSTSPDGNPATTAQVDVRDNSFAPSTISPGATGAVTWRWRGAAAHNVTFEDGVGSSGTQVSGTHSRTFTTPGTYRYRCTIHSTNFTSGMAGAVTVP